MATVRKRTWKYGGEAKTAWIADYFDQDGKRHIKTFTREKDANALAGDDAGRGGARRPHAGERQHHRRRGGRALDRERRAREARALDAAAVPQPCRSAHQSRIGSEKLARLSTPVIEAFRDDLLKKCSRPMARKVLTSLKSILGEAQRRGLVAQNAAQPVRVDVEAARAAQARGRPRHPVEGRDPDHPVASRGPVAAVLRDRGLHRDARHPSCAA